ncbi:MAG TPA: hypothetical protein DD491_06845 [Halieaceae bacterium]|nr:hypothetical protein [Halieaceae bacterium]
MPVAARRTSASFPTALAAIGHYETERRTLYRHIDPRRAVTVSRQAAPSCYVVAVYGRHDQGWQLKLELRRDHADDAIGDVLGMAVDELLRARTPAFTG